MSIKKVTILAMASLLAAGCMGDNPEYCADDATCQDPNREGYDQAKKYCHKDGNFCHTGCIKDTDCNTKTATNSSWYDPARPYCDVKSHTCVAKASLEAGADAGDGPLPDLTDMTIKPDGAKNGTPCGGDVLCASGFCVDGYCCEKQCGGECESCAVSGKEGKCEAIAKDTDPDSECLGEKGCGMDVCDGNRKCTLPLGSTVVCMTACTSSNKELETYHCDGAGKCSTAATTPNTSCAPYFCEVGTKTVPAACATSCKDHTKCVSGSGCDRSAAHKTGLGVCIAINDVTSVVDDTALNTAITNVIAGSSTSHILLTGTSYKTTINLTKGSVTIMGDGTSMPTITPSGSVAPITVKDGATLVLQGVKVSGSKAAGIDCDGSSSSAGKLTVVESEVTGSVGLGISGVYCDVELRRNRINTNKKGGASLTLGAYKLVNNLVTKNGEAGVGGSQVGGISMAPASAAKVVFVNNTVADNSAQKKEWMELICSSMAEDVANSIVWNAGYNATDKVIQGCTFSYSDVQGQIGGTNLASDPLFNMDYTLKSKPTVSPCIDKGNSTTETVIDINGNPRPDTTGNKLVDMGAFEVQ